MKLTRSLHLRVVLPILLIVGGGGLVLTLAGAVYGRRALQEAHLSHARDLAAAARDSVSILMRRGHSEELDPLIRQFGVNRDISALRILAPDGTVRRSTRAAEVGSSLPAHTVADETSHLRVRLTPAAWAQPAVLHTVMPLPNGPECRRCHSTAGAMVALLDVDIDTSREAAAFQSWWRLNGALAALEGVLVIVVVATLLHLIVIRPLRRLAATMSRVNRGTLTAHMEPGGSFEVDELVAGFNAMVVRLHEASQAEETARRLQVEHAEHLAAVGRMATGLAHEIRNPLSGVQVALEVLAGELGHDTRKRDLLLQSITELNRVEKTLKALLDYARPRLPSLQRSDLNGVLVDTIAFVRPEVEAQGILLEWNPTPNLPAVTLDATMIHQVLLNLIINAVHAIGVGKGGRIRVTTEAHLNQVVCRVTDTGPGIRTDEHEKIFVAFFTTKSRGTGLGLAISRRLVELHGGHLVLENPGQAGASFAFVLPLTYPTSAGIDAGQATAPAAMTLWGSA